MLNREGGKRRKSQPYLNNHDLYTLHTFLISGQQINAQMDKHILKGTTEKCLQNVHILCSRTRRLPFKTIMLRLLHCMPVAIMIIFKTKDFMS